MASESEKEKQQPRKDKGADRSASDIPLIEWIAAGIGALIVGTIVVFLVIKAFNWNESEPPMMHVEAQQVFAGPGGYVLKIDA